MRNFFYKLMVMIKIREGGFYSRFLSDVAKEDILFPVFVCIFLTGAVLFGSNQYHRKKDAEELLRQQQALSVLKEQALEEEKEKQEQKKNGLAEGVNDIINKNSETELDSNEKKENFIYAENGMLAEYAALYEKNPDIIGWLKIDNTVIDYPVMQTPEDEEYYLRRDFYGQENQNGSLLMDTDSRVGIGRKEEDYAGGNYPSANIIIHGHTMKTGIMFGMLERYKEKTYGEEHRLLHFDSLYEKREYELMAVFYSDIYKDTDRVFKYYNFFQAETKEEFQDWYTNVKKLSLYDTGVEAEFGDEFLTLSCCAYQSDDRRFVVVAKRLK